MATQKCKKTVGRNFLHFCIIKIHNSLDSSRLYEKLLKNQKRRKERKGNGKKEGTKIVYDKYKEYIHNHVKNEPKYVT